MNEGRAIRAILMAALMGSMSAGGFYWAHQLEPAHSANVGMFVRIVVSFLCLFAFARFERSQVHLYSWKRGKYLWLWGVLGAITFAAYFQSVLRIGSGPATLLNAGGGVLIAGVSYRRHGDTQNIHLLGAVGAFAGLMLFSVALLRNGLDLMGTVMALASGLSASMAYLLISKMGRAPSTGTIALHWSLVNMLAVSISLFLTTSQWPHTSLVWLILVISSVAMSLSQFLTAFAFQHGTASLIACLGFLAPLLSLFMDSLLFRRPLSFYGFLGALLVVGFGIVIPLKTWLKARARLAAE